MKNLIKLFEYLENTHKEHDVHLNETEIKWIQKSLKIVDALCDLIDIPITK